MRESVCVGERGIEKRERERESVYVCVKAKRER